MTYATSAGEPIGCVMPERMPGVVTNSAEEPPNRRNSIVCLGCVHAQPKRSAVPVFRRMLVSHERALKAAQERGEPAGQIAARELEVGRIRQAMQRAEELTMDVAAAIEAAAG